MKITTLPLLLITLLTSACSDATPPSAETPTTPVPSAPATPPAPATTTPSPLTELKWSDIKDLGYDDRADVMAGLAKLREKLDLKIAALEARRADLTTKDDPLKFNAALKTLDTARTRLTSSITDLGNATSQNWEQRHDRVADAWVNVEDAYKKAAGEAPATTAPSRD
ncbi:MAG: hypothetical protein ACAH89_03780 [Rariglobus sp.]|nr:hypothetical protein [Rariglobus sp.]